MRVVARLGLTTFSTALVVLAACGRGERSETETSRVDESTSRVYPVDPQVHVEDKSLDASNPGTIHAHVLNAVAYARYGVATLSPEGTNVPEDAESIATLLGSLGAKSGISPARVVELYRIEGTEAEYDRRRAHVLEGAQGVSDTAPLSSVGHRIVDLEKQVAGCTSSPGGPSAEACCTALAVPWFLLDPASKLDAPARTALDAEASAGTLYSSLPARKLSEERAEEGSVQPFEHQNIKAFLAVCAPIVRHVPADLAALKARYGDYAHDSGWAVELHPISMAKLAARRIYRSAKDKISIAESIGEDCSVRETEVVVERSDGLMDFWSFGANGERETHGFFPARLHVDAIKHTPDSCMGCHYKLDTRRFDVRAPSYRALALVLRKSQGAPQWIDGSSCGRPTDTIVWHERP